LTGKQARDGLLGAAIADRFTVSLAGVPVYVRLHVAYYGVFLRITPCFALGTESLPTRFPWAFHGLSNEET